MSSLIPVADVAAQAGVAPRNVARYIHDGRLPAEQISGNWYVRSHDATKFIAERKARQDDIHDNEIARRVKAAGSSFSRAIDSIVALAIRGDIPAEDARQLVCAERPLTALQDYRTQNAATAAERTS